MNEPHDPNKTVDVPSAPHDEPNQTVDVSSVPSDSLDAGLAAGFGRPAEAPRSSLDASQRPVLLHEAKGESDHIVKPHSDAMPPKSETGDRYQLFGEIARGGMGAVLRGRDVDLGRDLAVKVLLEKHADNPAVARRFLEEAQIGGQLQHPGVVPVYDIGRFGDRPFFTMKLVKGKTLAALLDERGHKRPACEPQPTSGPLVGTEQPTSGPLVATDLPRFLDIALKVAQAMAYAHAKGVIHRDLKPANVMVGAFGEVQVMDWGLAKVLAEGGVADEERASRERQRPEDGTQIRTARSTGSTGTFGSNTEAGTLLGTPAYMPPEQTNGDIAILDRRADVFGLGAILCEILTGKPPYVGRSYEEVRRKAANGDLAEALARLNACGVDEELIGLTKACLSAEAVDRPTDALAVAEALTAYLDGVQERLRKAELAEAEARAKAVEEAKRRRLTLALAATVLFAVTLGGGGWQWVKNERQTRQAQVNHDVNEALNRATAFREQAKTINVGGAASFAQAREQAQRALALVENGLADETLTNQVRQLQAELDEEDKDRKLVVALDEARLEKAETLTGKNRFASERAVPKFREAFQAYGMAVGQGEPVAAAARIRQRPAAVRESVVAALQDWDDLAANPEMGIHEPYREWLRMVLEAAELEDVWSRKVQVARRQTDAAKRLVALEALAKSAPVADLPPWSLDRLARELRLPQAAALLRRAQQQHPSNFWVNHDLGIVLGMLTPPQRNEAVRFLTAAAALRPKSPGVHVNLGVALKDKGQMDEAAACFRTAIELDPKYAVAHNNLGGALVSMGQIDAAIASFRTAIELDSKYAMAHDGLGTALFKRGQLDSAIAYHRTAIKLDPKYALAHNNLGNALTKKGRLDSAIASYRTAIKLDPKLAISHSGVGNALYEKGQVQAAMASYRQAVELDPKYPGAHVGMGNVLRTRGQVDSAIASFRTAIELDPKNPAARVGLGNALHDKGQVDEAIASFRKAIELDPKDAIAHSNLGNELKAKGRLNEAITHYRTAIELDPKHTLAHYNLGNALVLKGRLDEAIASYRKAVAFNPKHAPVHYNLGNALKARGRLDEAITCYRTAVELDPKDPGCFSNLGNALRVKGQLDAAIACLRTAVALDPKGALVHNNLGVALEAKGQLDEAITCYRKAVKLDSKHAGYLTNLGSALSNKGLDEAIACFRKAILLDPKHGRAHAALGLALLRKGRYAEARDSATRALDLFPEDNPNRPATYRLVRECRRLVRLEERLPRLIRGEDNPTSAREGLELAGMCHRKRLFTAAARFAAAAFAADPRLAEELTPTHRYNAACSAALAAAGQGEDAAKLNDKERARLHQQALDWLRADLDQQTKQIDSSSGAARQMVLQKMRHWQEDADLAGIRDKAALAKLPADEQKACTKLWSDVAELLKKTDTPTTKKEKK